MTPMTPRRPDPISRAASILATLVLLGLLLLVYRGVGTLALPRFLGATPLWCAGLGAGLYLLAHVARALRLALLVSDDGVTLRKIFQAHFLGAGASLIVPFKLGELYRIYEISRAVGSPARALLAVWIERALDLLTISALMAVGLAVFPSLLPAFSWEIIATFTLILLTFAVFFVVPENIEALKLAIIRGSNSPRALIWLRLLDAAQRFLRQAPGMLAGRGVALGGLTVIVWLLEVLTISLFLPAGAGALRAALLGLAFIFSSLLPGSRTGLAEVSRRIELDLGPGADVIGGVGLYGSVVFPALLVVAGVVFLAVVPARLRSVWAALQRAGGRLPIPAGGEPA